MAEALSRTDLVVLSARFGSTECWLGLALALARRRTRPAAYWHPSNQFTPTAKNGYHRLQCGNDLACIDL